MDASEIRTLLQSAKIIAVVGLSPDPYRPSHDIAAYLDAAGYKVFGVNPESDVDEVFGVPILDSLDQVPGPLDIVDVFRRPEYTPDAARAAVAAGARALWLQLGIRNPEARAIAEAGGLAYVEDRCIKVEHGRLMG